MNRSNNLPNFNVLNPVFTDFDECSRNASVQCTLRCGLLVCVTFSVQTGSTYVICVTVISQRV
jgi:hypothetical protein